MVGMWLCHIPTHHHYDISPPGGNMTGGNMLVGHDDNDDNDDGDDGGDGDGNDDSDEHDIWRSMISNNVQDNACDENEVNHMIISDKANIIWQGQGEDGQDSHLASGENQLTGTESLQILCPALQSHILTGPWSLSWKHLWWRENKNYDIQVPIHLFLSSWLFFL